jgi:hypothetical protein
MKLPAVLILVLGVSGALVAQQDYEIRLSRPDKPGDQFQVSVSGTSFEEMLATSDANTVQHTKDEFAVEYAAIRKVLEVERAGRPTKVQDTIQRLLVTRGNNRMELAPAGAILVAAVEDKKKKFKIDDNMVTTQTAKALEIVINLSTGGATDDDIFGTRARKKVGDSWNMNAAAAVEEIRKRSDVELRNLSGKVKLESVSREASGDVLNITGSMNGDGRLALPAIVLMFRGPFKASFSGKFPVDQALGRLEESMEMNLVFDASGSAPNGVPIRINGVFKRSATSKMRN